MPSLRALRRLVLCASALAVHGAAAQTTAQHGKRYARLIIRNALVIDGTGTPASGPYDIVIENNRIGAMVPLDPVAMSAGVANRPKGDAEIDATGKYVLPGLVNAHGHVQDERGGQPQPVEYELKIWLASGITSVRDVGSDTRTTIPLRAKIASGEIAGPRIFHYPFFFNPFGGSPISTPEQARAHVREMKQQGVDGIKITGIKRDLMEAMEDEAHKVGLRVAHHAAVEETNAWDDIRLGTTSVEHWYGIPDAAIADGVQSFPAEFNISDETHRFRYAGRLWREADPAKLKDVLAGMVKANVAWVPTLDIYEASRDLTRAQNQPWFKDYLHPSLEEYFKPNPANHGSYFIGWTSVDEAYWKENYQIWFRALRDFERLGGTIASGDDAGFIYQMYGWGLIRELELEQEAGFSPLKIIQHATSNGAKVLGKENEIGRIRTGWLADVIVVNGNPLADLKMLYPTGTEGVKDGKIVHTGGVEWTIKDGIAYNGPTLLADVKEIVAKARAERARATKTGGSEH
jgi:imidazolonepropionase-like amidohydrolase